MTSSLGGGRRSRWTELLKQGSALSVVWNLNSGLGRVISDRNSLQLGLRWAQNHTLVPIIEPLKPQFSIFICVLYTILSLLGKRLIRTTAGQSFPWSPIKILSQKGKNSTKYHWRSLNHNAPDMFYSRQFNDESTFKRHLSYLSNLSETSMNSKNDVEHN